MNNRHLYEYIVLTNLFRKNWNFTEIKAFRITTYTGNPIWIEINSHKQTFEKQYENNYLQLLLNPDRYTFAYL
jgi:hypothetical protein